jgi:hypothetical protein
MTSIESPVTEVNHNDRDSHFRIGPALTVAAAIGALGARFFLVISKYSVNVFFFDQWDFNNATLFERHTLWEMFRWQHGPHRQGLGALLTWLFEPLFSWNSRAGPFFIGACLFAAMLFALRLKCKLYGPLSHSDVAIPTIFLTLAQFEVMFNAPNPAYSGLPMLMIMLYCLALLRRSRLPSYALVLSLNFLLIYTGYGLLMGAITLGVFLLECYWSWRHMTSVPFAQALAGFGVAAASLASFFVHYQPVTAADCFEIPHRHLLQYPRFMALMFSAFVVPRPFLLSSGVTLLGGATILIVLGAVFCLHLLHLLKSPRPASHLIGAILVSFSGGRRGRTPVPRPERGVYIALLHPVDSGLLGHLLLSLVEELARNAKPYPCIVGNSSLACRYLPSAHEYPLVCRWQTQLGQLLYPNGEYPLL